MKEILYYRKQNGKIPFFEFLKNIDEELSSKIFHKIELLSIDLLGYADVKYLRDKVYELRVRDENNIVRIFYFSKINNEIIILDGFIKKENKLKKQILYKVIEYKNDYIKRIG